MITHNWIIFFVFSIAYHLLELATMTPLSMEKLSLGNPKMFHAWILIGSPKVLLRENSCEQGIFLS